MSCLWSDAWSFFESISPNIFTFTNLLTSSWLMQQTVLSLRVVTLRDKLSLLLSVLSVCLFVGLLPRWFEIACIDLHQTGSVGEGSDHLQLIKFWPSCAPGKGVCGGAKIFGSALLQPARSVCVASEHFFHSPLTAAQINCLHINCDTAHVWKIHATYYGRCQQQQQRWRHHRRHRHLLKSATNTATVQVTAASPAERSVTFTRTRRGDCSIALITPRRHAW